jgi:hypothetical protein
MISRVTKLITLLMTMSHGIFSLAQTTSQEHNTISNNQLGNNTLNSLNGLSNLPSIRLWDWWFKQKEIKRSLMVQPNDNSTLEQKVSKEKVEGDLPTSLTPLMVNKNNNQNDILMPKPIVFNDLNTVNGKTVEQLDQKMNSIQSKPDVLMDNSVIVAENKSLMTNRDVSNTITASQEVNNKVTEKMDVINKVTIPTTISSNSDKTVKVMKDIQEKNQIDNVEPVSMQTFNTIIKQEKKVIKDVKNTQKSVTRVIYEPLDLLPEDVNIYKRIVMRSGDKLSNSLREFLLENQFELSWQVENGNGKARDYQLLERAVFVASDLNNVLEKVIEPFGLYAKVYEQEKIVVISNEPTESAKTTN